MLIFLSEVNLTGIKNLHLITTLIPKSFDQIKKIGSLISLIEFPLIQNKEISCQISLNNKLHGKIYIFKKNEIIISAIITSANFTDSGLSRNHEWGIEINDQSQIKTLEESIIHSIEISDVSFDEILQMQKAANDFLANQPQVEERLIDLNLTDHVLSNSWVHKLDESIDYWLKPIGYSEGPVLENRLFSNKKEYLHFSKQRPNGVKPNDILIAYGVGTTKILSIYRVTSYPEHSTEEEINEEEWLKRWPWYVEADNLTPKYGGKWSQYNFYNNSLKDEYLKLYPNNDITAVGGQSLGALQFGKDKLKLSVDFAQFIINKIAFIEAKI